MAKDANNQLAALRTTLMSKEVLAGIRERMSAKIDPDLVVRCAMSSLARPDWRGQQLRQCSPSSIILALYDASQLGLPPDDVKGLAYLIPYKQECKLIVGYRGMITLAMRSRRVKFVDAFVVCDGDVCDVRYGDSPSITHIPKVSPAGDAENVTAVYAIATLDDGTKVMDFMWREELDKTRRSSKASKEESPWNQWPVEMMKKTAIRRLCSHKLSFLPEVMDAVAKADEAEFREDVKSVDSFVVEVAGTTEGVVEQAIEAATKPKKTLEQVQAEKATGLPVNDGPKLKCKRCLAAGQPADGPCDKCGCSNPATGEE